MRRGLPTGAGRSLAAAVALGDMSPSARPRLGVAWTGAIRLVTRSPLAISPHRSWVLADIHDCSLRMRFRFDGLGLGPAFDESPGKPLTSRPPVPSLPCVTKIGALASERAAGSAPRVSTLRPPALPENLDRLHAHRRPNVGFPPHGAVIPHYGGKGQAAKPLKRVAHPARFERATSAFGGQRSIQLSYGCSGRSVGAHHRQGGRRRQWAVNA